MVLFFRKNSKKQVSLRWAERDFICILNERGMNETQIQDFISMVFDFLVPRNIIRYTITKGIDHFAKSILTHEEIYDIHEENLKIIDGIIKKYRVSLANEVDQVLQMKNFSRHLIKDKLIKNEMTDQNLVKLYQTLFDQSRLLANEPTEIHKFETLTDDELRSKFKELDIGTSIYLAGVGAEKNRGKNKVLEAPSEAIISIKKQCKEKVNTRRE